MTNPQRRNILKVGFLASSVVVMQGCDLFGVTTLRDTLRLLQYDLYPKAEELQIDTLPYINKIILHHPRVTKSEKNFIKNGFEWLNEEAVQMYQKMYAKLSKQERQNVLTSVAQTEWGSSWMDTMLGYIFEASFGDPIYGGNTQEVAWKWLEFVGGEPRAKRMYL